MKIQSYGSLFMGLFFLIIGIIGLYASIKSTADSIVIPIVSLISLAMICCSGFGFLYGIELNESAEIGTNKESKLEGKEK